MDAHPLLAAGLAYAVLMTVALVRLGRGVGGLDWAAAWMSLWAAGGIALMRDQWSLAVAFAAIPGTLTATLFVTGTLRYVGRRVPSWLWLAGLTIAALRAALAPLVPLSVTEISGGLLIGTSALAASALLLEPRRPDGSRRHLLLAAAFPAATVGAAVYTWGMVVGEPFWLGVFVWLMAGILLSGVQVVSMIRRMAERAEDERAVLASLIGSVPVGLALFDESGTLRAANHAFVKLLGQSADGPITREADVLSALGEQVEWPPGALQELPGDGGTQPGQELRFKNGLRVGATVHAVTGADDAVAGRLWLLRDVTEERQLQEGLERARRLDTLGGFAGGVAHDFNNQLTSVIGNAVLARELLGEGHPAQEVLADLARSAEYCARLTRDVLDFARRGSSRSVRVELATLLPEILARCPAARAELEVESGLPPIEVDPMQVERVVANLLDNARHAAGPDGRVSLRALRQAPGHVSIEVWDDGPGIDERSRARIFDPFFTTKPVGEGSGLGLAIVYGIVTGHGGSVHVEPAPGGGTRMVTTWPAEPDAR